MYLICVRHYFIYRSGASGYRDAENEEKRQQERLDELQSLGENLNDELVLPSLSDLFAARVSGMQNKIPGGDGVVNEMVRTLPVLVCYALLFLFHKRICCRHSKCSLWWKHFIMCGIPKAGGDKGIGRWRFIALTSVLQKLFLTVLLQQARLSLKRYVCHIYGFEPGRCTEDISEVLRMLIQKCANWDISLYVISADIKTAFPCLRHEYISNALIRRGLHP